MAKVPKKMSKSEKEEIAKKLLEQLKNAMKEQKKVSMTSPGGLAGVPDLSDVNKVDKEILKKVSKSILKIVNKYKEVLLSKFGKYIKSIVVFGSSVSKDAKKTSDIDVAVIIDDTDVRRMGFVELKERLLAHMISRAFMVNKKIHPQVYVLTEFWEYIRDANPVIYNILRTGVPIYDTGFFLPIQLLLKKGKIIPSEEAIDKLVFSAEKLVELTEDTITQKLAYNLHLAVITAAQAILLEYGYRPPRQKETPVFIKEILYKKKKIITKELAEDMENVVLTFKKIEHKEIKEINCIELNKMLNSTKKFISIVKKKLEELRENKEEISSEVKGEFKEELLLDPTKEVEKIAKELGHR